MNTTLKVQATEYLLEGFPGAVAFHFTDAYGAKQELIEKLPVLGLDFPERPDQVPFTFEIAFDVLEILDNNIAKIRLPHGIGDRYGNSEFYIKIRR